MTRSHLPILRSYLRPHWREFLLGVLALLLVNILATYIPWLLKDAVNELEKQFSADRVALYGVAIAGLASVMWLIRMGSRMLLFGIGRKVEYQLKQEIFEHIVTLPTRYFALHPAGEIISITTSDVENIRRLLGFAILSLINTFFAYALTLPVMFLIDTQLSLIALSVYPIMFGLVSVFSGQLRDEQLKIQEELSNVSNLLQEDLNGMALIKTYAQELNEQKAFHNLNSRLLGANLKIARTRSVLFPLLGGIASISFLLLLWFGGEKLVNREPGFDIGELLSLISYVNYLIFPTALLGFTITAYQRGQVSIDRIQNVLDIPSAIVDSGDAKALEPQSLKGELEVRSLSFSYPDSKQTALRDVSFQIAAGEKIAIIGPVGCGKSTLANVLLRLVDIPSGTIFLDGMDSTNLKIEDLRRAVTFVPQESFLFSATIANNIRYGRPESGMNEVEDYATQARIHPEIINFPQQYETLVGERGITLSGGQRQRSALARALLMDAAVVVLDDALSSVDNRTATEILQSLPQSKTVIFITHNLSAAATCDRILLMEQGRVKQVGSHSELLETSETYQTLWNQHQLSQKLL
ncbi:MAG: ABC transporter ATP-binding protein [Oscillatoriales cyanobacterium SM2_2_1]|nr:ABC transporter ATP-binding protein [Oscillatoriales cyanobacterium SM2_2_1]